MSSFKKGLSLFIIILYCIFALFLQMNYGAYALGDAIRFYHFTDDGMKAIDRLFLIRGLSLILYLIMLSVIAFRKKSGAKILYFSVLLLVCFGVFFSSKHLITKALLPSVLSADAEGATVVINDYVMGGLFDWCILPIAIASILLLLNIGKTKQKN